jgi:plasmid stabilization system protein ParE
MSRKVVFRPEAEGDLLEAHDWYEEQQVGMGAEFSDALEKTITRIETMPEMYAIVLRGVRRAKLRRFPYLIYYRLLDDRIEVMGYCTAAVTQNFGGSALIRIAICKSSLKFVFAARSSPR